MQVSQLPRPSLWSLVASWLSLSGQIVRSFGTRLREILDRSQDTVKDSILDLELGRDAAEEMSLPPSSLPPVDGQQLAKVLRERYEVAMRQVAEVINEDPYGCLSQITEDRVLKLLRDLGREALEQAFELQVEAAEAQLPVSQVPQGEWAKKFRRMLAAEGRWPHPGALKESAAEGIEDLGWKDTLRLEPFSSDRLNS
jgi:hypothetical protein